MGTSASLAYDLGTCEQGAGSDDDVRRRLVICRREERERRESAANRRKAKMEERVGEETAWTTPKWAKGRKAGECVLCGGKEGGVGPEKGGPLRWDWLKGAGPEDYPPQSPLRRLYAHELCLYFSPFLVPNSEKSDGALAGFSEDKIRKEFNRSSKFSCFSCKKKGATVGCFEEKCPKSFHFPCAYNSGALCEFMDEFRVWCEKHRPSGPDSVPMPKSSISLRSSFKGVGRMECGLCRVGRVATAASAGEVVRTSCCPRGNGEEGRHITRYYHYACVQAYAVSAGEALLRCPFCANQDLFLETLLNSFLYIPPESPEEEVLADTCLMGKECARDPRQFKDVPDNVFDMDEKIVCVDCGAVVHRMCAGEPWNDEGFDGEEPNWSCDGCAPVVRSRGALDPRTFRTPTSLRSSTSLRASTTTPRAPPLLPTSSLPTPPRPKEAAEKSGEAKSDEGVSPVDAVREMAATSALSFGPSHSRRILFPEGTPTDQGHGPRPPSSLVSAKDTPNQGPPKKQTKISHFFHKS